MIPITMGKNTIRRATLADVLQMAEVFAAGFVGDDVYDRFMHPRRKEFPDDWLQHWVKEVRRHIIDPAGLCFVGIDKQDAIKACCLMKKLGDISLQIPLMSYQTNDTAGYVSVQSTSANRAADPGAHAIYEKNWDDIEHHFSGPRGQAWFIVLLCVHPDVQKGSGYGRDFVQNAIRLAEYEHPPVPLAVISSEIADAFYDRYGFREVGRADVGDMSVVKGGSIKFYEQHLTRRSLDATP